MRILITGACGFAGFRLAQGLLQAAPGLEIIGLDNLSRPGSETNRAALAQAGIRFIHADVRSSTDLQALPAVDWVLDGAANPSVMAGVDGRTSSAQVVEHNLYGTVNTLEYCRRVGAGFTMLSTSRVYSIPPLAGLSVRPVEGAFVPEISETPGLSAAGIAEEFSTSAPVSLYGATKLASEALALEYFYSFGVPVWLNRCGVLAGPGQFGKADQGIFSYWIHSYAARRALRYIGFGGQGHQVRDCLDPLDLVPALLDQMNAPMGDQRPRICNFAGGPENAMSLAQLHAWCERRFGFAHEVGSDPAPRPNDLPWVVLDNRRAQSTWGWKVVTPLCQVLESIAAHAESHPHWLDLAAQ